MYKKTPKFTSILSLTTIVLLITLTLSTFPLLVKASSGTILINTATPPSALGQSVAYGGNVNLFLGGVTWSGTNFSLYLSRDHLAQLSAGDNLYTPQFNVSDLTRNAITNASNSTMTWTIGFNWVNGSIPKSPVITSTPGGPNFIKASDGAAATLAVSDTSIFVNGVFHVHSLNTGPGSGAILLEGHGFIAGGTANIQWLNPSTSTFVPLVSNLAIDSLGNFLYNTFAPDLMLNNPAGDNPPQSNTMTFQAQDNSNSALYNTSAPLTYTEMRRGLTQLGGAAATGLFGNNTSLSSSTVGVSQSLVITGKWFAPGNASISFDATPVGITAVNGTGFFNTTVTIPSVGAGAHQVQITDADGYKFLATISVVPTLTLIPPAGPVGMPITVKGSSFAPGASVNLSWFGNIVDVPGIAGHVATYTIKSGITADSNGTFTTSIISPSDFSDITHLVNATQNGVGTGIANATFTTVPTMILSPQPANYISGQQVFLNITGGPLGSAALPITQASSATVLKFTYDNVMWGFDTSHLSTEGPVATGGFIGWDVGGNISIRFKAVGEVGTHSIRAYAGEKDTPIWLSCEIGGDATFNITGPSSDTQTILNNLASLNSNILSIQGNTATIMTNLGTVTTSLSNIGATVGSIQGDTATIKTSLGTVSASLSAIDAKIVSVQGDTATIMTSLGPVNASLNDINAKLVSLQGDTATIETSLGTLNGTVTSISNDVVTIKTSIGTLTLNNVKTSADNAVNYILVAIVLLVISLVIMVAVAFRMFTHARRLASAVAQIKR